MGFGAAIFRRRRRRVKPFLWAGFSTQIFCSKSRASIPWRFGGEAGSFIFLRVALFFIRAPLALSIGLFYARSGYAWTFLLALRLCLRAGLRQSGVALVFRLPSTYPFIPASPGLGPCWANLYRA